MMAQPTLDTLPRSEKGPVEPPPRLEGIIGTVAQVVAGWPGVTTSAHWDLYDSTKVDGIDFYVDDQELGHIHLDGALHLATNPDLRKILIAEKRAQPFRYARGWVCESVTRVGSAAATDLFHRNYRRLKHTAS